MWSETMVFLNLEVQKFVQFRYLESLKTYERIAFNIRYVSFFCTIFLNIFHSNKYVTQDTRRKSCTSFMYSGLKELFGLNENWNYITGFVKFFSIKFNGNPYSGSVVSCI
jgi:hypothetical protein